MARQPFSVLFGVVLATALGLVSGTPPVNAQQPAAPAQGGAGGRTGGRGGAQAAAPAQLDLATAKRIAAAAGAAATAAGAKVGIAIVDANGDLVYLERLDGAAGRPITSAQAKARSAILFGLPTKAIADAVAAGTPLQTTLTPAVAGTFEISFNQGGIPLVRNGKVVGGVGVGGSSSDQDEAFAKAGAETFK